MAQLHRSRTGVHTEQPRGLHPPANVPQHTAEHVVGEETGIQDHSNELSEEKRLKFNFHTKMFAR